MSATDHKAVFLSYASQDAEAARRICDALRAAGVEVWFDQSELRGGDAWDQKIRKQIKDCALFMPIISANTQARAEGYFRLEWRLADQRTHLMGKSKAFLLPVCIDDTRDAEADVPDSFLVAQWTRLSATNALAALADRVGALLGLERQRASGDASVVIPAMLPADAPRSPSARGIAVLAFANLSHDPENEYFSDGISEELLNVLAKIPGLRVTARTSSFHFKGRNLPIRQIAQELGVSHVVEGSVRRAGNRVRITAQLIDALEDAHLWSDTFDRELKDIFAVQDEIAGLIAQNLQLRLAGGNRGVKPVNPDAYRLCLEGRRGLQMMTEDALARAEQAFLQALKISPNLAIASVGLAQLASVRIRLAGGAAKYRLVELNHAEKCVRDALRSDPLSGEAHAVAALVAFVWGRLSDASAAYAQAVDLGASPEALTASVYGIFWLRMGRPDRGAAEMEQLCRRDPLSWLDKDMHGHALMHAGRPADALPIFEAAEQLGAAPITYAHHAIALGRLGRREDAIRKAREALDPAKQRVWGEHFILIGAHFAAWALAAAGACDEALVAVEQVQRGPERFRWGAGVALAVLGRDDEAFAAMAETPQMNVGFLLGFLHDYPRLHSDPRCAQLLRELNAEKEFEILKRVRRGDALE